MSRILTIDIGNTNIVMGLFEHDQLEAHCRLQTQAGEGVAAYESQLYQDLHQLYDSSVSITGGVVCSVVPRLTPVFVEMAQKLIGQAPIVMDSNLALPITIDTHTPAEVGQDRIANAVGAYQRFQQACIVIDSGTATTMDVVFASGSFQGGVICPGMRLMAESLSQQTAQLPSIALQAPPLVIGKSTQACLQAGVMYGQLGMIESMVNRLKTEMQQQQQFHPLVIATGGMMPWLAEHLTGVDHVVEHLTLEGLREVYNYIKPG